MTKFNSIKTAAALAEHMKAGDKARAIVAESTEAINAIVADVRTHIKDTKSTIEKFFAGNARTNEFRAAMKDQFKAAGITDSTARVYVAGFIQCVESGKKFTFGMLNGADKAKAKAAEAKAIVETANSEQIEPNAAPTPSTSATVHTAETIKAAQSEAGNNGPDVQQKPDATPHDLAVQYLETARLNINQAFLLLGKIHYKTGQANCQDIAQQIADMIAFVNEAKK